MTVLAGLRTLAKDRARIGLRLWGRATWRLRMSPDFVVAGAQRCGTTSLYRTLAQHPDVVPPLPGKGVHHFDTADAFARGRSWYVGHFPLRAPALLRSGGRARTGEASPYYLFHPLAAQRMEKTVPEARVVVLVRDPVERAFSAWKQERGRGFEDEDFERALELEEARLAGEAERIVADSSYQSFHHQHHAYVARGRYAEQLRRMEATLRPGSLLVLETDEALAGSGEPWDRLLDHLRLHPWDPGVVPRANARPSHPMPEHVRRRLSDLFEGPDAELVHFLGHVPSWRS